MKLLSVEPLGWFSLATSEAGRWLYPESQRGFWVKPLHNLRVLCRTSHRQLWGKPFADGSRYSPVDLPIIRHPCCTIHTQKKKVHSKHASQTPSLIPASFFTPTTCPIEIHKTQPAEAATAGSFEMYYFSCESFSWNYKLHNFRATPA